MSELCQSSCIFYKNCKEVAEQDPAQNEKTFRQMGASEDLRTRKQIEAAKELISLEITCRPETTDSPRDCRIVAGAALKNLIG